MRGGIMKDINKIYALGLVYGNDNYDDNYLVDDDEEVFECIINMYFYMLTGKKEDYDKFELLYDKLTSEQKEIIRDDYISIMKYKGDDNIKILKLNNKI